METTTTASAIANLLPRIRERREGIERSRRMPPDLIDAMTATALFRLGVPRAFGGQEVPFLELMRSVETIATADGSAGWIAMIGATANMAAGYMEEAGAREVFSNPLVPTAGIASAAGTASRVDGGVRVSGRWPFASGITHCDWAWAGCVVVEGGAPVMTPAGPEIIHVFIPTSEIEIHDTWHVSGLSGTGSQDFSIRDVFVPTRRIFNLLDPASHRKEPLYQFPALQSFVFPMVCVGLGIARAALDELTALAETKVPLLRAAVLADASVAQVEIAKAEGTLGAARSYLYEMAEDMWRTVCDGRPPTNRQLALGRIAATQAVETAAKVARTANTLAGGSSIYSRSSLQRHMRDADAITHHFTVAPLTWEDAGRVLLGRQPTIPIF